MDFTIIFKIPLNPPLAKGEVKSRGAVKYVGGIVPPALRASLHSLSAGVTSAVPGIPKGAHYPTTLRF